MRRFILLSGRLALAVVAGLVLVNLGPGTAAADRVVSSGEPIVVSNDIDGTTTEVISASSSSTVEPLVEGKSNNGHGNNEDGVDSSNPSQGHGGPNGMADESCPEGGTCVDDEAGGGGSAVAQSNGNNGKAKGKDK